MGRTYFPTQNTNGVRDLSGSVTLSGYGFDYTGYRGPAETPARAAMNPVTLGASMALRAPISRLPVLPPIVLPKPPQVQLPLTSSGPASPPVSLQTSPTPQVTAPSTPPPTYILVTSGGGTASPAPATAAAQTVPASANIADQVAAWLGGSTAIGTYSIPNALLAGGIVLGFALLSSGGKKR